MARIRTLKPQIWEDPAFGLLSDTGKLTYINRVTQSDDAGRFLAATAAVAASLNPTKPPPLKKVRAALRELADAGLIVLYDHQGGVYGCFPTWAKHQRINRPQPPQYPPPPERLTEQADARRNGESVSHSVNGSMSDSTPDRKGREGIGGEGSVRGGGEARPGSSATRPAVPRPKAGTGACERPNLDQDRETRDRLRRLRYEGKAP